MMPASSPAVTHVCPPDHNHAAATTCYHKHHCRCVPCEEHARRKQATRRRLIAYGRWQPMVPATRARNHIRVLRATGVGVRRIAALSGVSFDHVKSISQGVTRLVGPDLEARILQIVPGAVSVAPGQLVDATITRRCLQALHARGWTARALADELGVTATNVSRFRRADRVTARTQEHVSALYERLWDQEPTCAERDRQVWRRRAAAAGWVPPLGWDDIYTDPEPPTPDEPGAVDVIAVELAVEGGRVPLTREERHLAVTQLHAAGHGDRLIAHMLLVDEKTILRDRQHLGLPAVEDPLPLVKGRAA